MFLKTKTRTVDANVIRRHPGINRFESSIHKPCVSRTMKPESMNSTIFEAFSKLTSDDEKIRIKGASGLIRILEETSEDKVS